jgi:hypothetical protein
VVINAFNQGVTIKSAKGFFLAIPTPAAPKTGIDGKRINPSNFPQNSLGRLRFVYRLGKPSLLVVDGLRVSTGKRGGFRKASASALKSGNGVTVVAMFLLVPQTRLKKRLDIDSAEAQWDARLPGNIMQSWPEI